MRPTPLPGQPGSGPPVPPSEAAKRRRAKAKTTGSVPASTGPAALSPGEVSDVILELHALAAIDSPSAAALASAGVETTADLLERCGRPETRSRTAAETGIAEERLRGWVVMAELLRINGVTPLDAELLVRSGVRGLADLCARSPGRLADTMLVVASEQQWSGLIPSAAVLEGWIRSADRLDPAVVEDETL